MTGVLPEKDRDDVLTLYKLLYFVAKVDNYGG